jgi:putative phosphoesterase
MQVALIGDVHANLPALEAVLDHAQELGIETVWNVGDFVGYGPFPDEVVKRLRNDYVLSIVGNYDRKVLKYKKKRKKWRKKKRLEKYLAFKWAYKNLSKKSRKYLRFLSREIRMQVKGWRVLLTHASPGSKDEYLDGDTSEKRLRQLAEQADADLIMCGHSHRPFVRQVDDVWFINPGSVGLPDDGDPRSSYAVLSIGHDQIDVQHHRLAYDVERTIEAIRENELPEAFAQMLMVGRNLNTVLQDREDYGL